MSVPFVDLQSQYQEYKQEIDTKIHQVLDSSSYIMGQEVKELEENLSGYTGSNHAIACSSGTDALLLALMSIGIQPGDEVITTPFTFIATAEAIAFLGAKPVFVDIEQDSFNINAAQIEQAVTDKTKAIIPVSLFGQPADMDEINEIAEKNGLLVIEDAAQSFGAEYKGRKSCNLSTIACTSFFPAKPLGCYGDGGAVFTSDSDVAKKIRILLNHGQNERYKHKYIGINGRLDALQAAVLNVKLQYFDKEVQKRNEIAKRYDNALEDTVLTPVLKPERSSVYAQYCVKSQKREDILEKLKKNGIPFAVYYPIPLHMQECFEGIGYKPGEFPVSEKVAKEIFALPMSAFLSIEDQDKVMKVMQEQ